MQRILFIFLWLPISALCCPPSDKVTEYKEPEDRGFGTMLDHMGKTNYEIKQKYYNRKLRTMPEEFKGTYLYGTYEFAGYGLLIFPNNKYVISYSCDICGNPELLESGTWEYKNNNILLNMEYRDSNTEMLDINYFKEVFGAYQTLHFFLTEGGKDKNFIGDSILISDEALNELTTSKEENQGVRVLETDSG